MRRTISCNVRAYCLLARGAVLLLMSLGLYRFWRMTDIRRFFWCHTEVCGNCLEYSGTPIALLLGFLIALALLIAIDGALFLAALDGRVDEWSSLIGLIRIGFLGQYAMYRAKRFRLSRTVYRGLCFSQTGEAVFYAVINRLGPVSKTESPFLALTTWAALRRICKG